LRVAVENDIRTIAFPAISCGAYRYPIGDATNIAVQTTRDFLRDNDLISQVTFVVSTDEIESDYQRLLAS
jgi:O-acetyl-ADP-ribose deacetylase (regulator of RNase III)